MGDKQNQPFQLWFNPCLKIDFQGSRATSESGLLWCGNWMNVWVGLLIGKNIRDDRRGKNTQLPPPDLLRQSVGERSR